jgi:hypothetical protein
VTDAQPLPLGQEWKGRLGLANRRSPELYESPEAVTDTPHALAIRAALDELGLSAVFCVQGTPTVAILSVQQYDRSRVIDLHGALWNQGLASLLLVIAGDTLRAFSLARKPFKELGDEFDRRCLIDTLNTTADALRFRNLVYGAESGRLWKEYADYFKPKERIDQVLLDNLKESHQSLRERDLSSDEAQALLIQTMFIAYLEDREILTPEYFLDASRSTVDSFSSLLATKNVRLLKSLFTKLRGHFNGDLFVAPCSFELDSTAPELAATHLDVLERFRTGREEMGKGRQLRFWGYNFRYIPIELVSAVYDRFLGEKEEERREQGAYYTPMFLADTVVSQVWEQLPSDVREKGRYLDPACGSGVFLVRSFQRLCEHWRATRTSRTIRWDSLLAILQRVHGWDLNGSAVRVAVFSLYVALLEEVSPPDIRRLFDRGKILPELWDKNLIRRDFFDVSEDGGGFDVIVGNPPWTSRRGANRSSVRWCKKHRLPMPGGEDAWAFAWKALRHVSDGGVIAFLLPAMGFLHNHADSTVSARNRFIRESRIRRIINFADLRFQLFEGANRPAALIIFGKSRITEFPYRFDYWAPKADSNLQIKRLITLSSVDKTSIGADAAQSDPLVFKRRLWMREPDEKLFSYLARLSSIGGVIQVYGDLARRRLDQGRQWVIGDGFKQAVDERTDDESYDVVTSEYVGRLRHLPIGHFRPFALANYRGRPWHTSVVHRRGFEEGFQGPRILVPRGVQVSKGRIRASYVEQPLTFFSIIQAITIPSGQESRAKLLTALLNSRVLFWFAFHGTASFGSDRPEIQKSELLRLPFPSAADLPEPDKAEEAGKKLVAVIDEVIQAAKAPLAFDSGEDEVLARVDQQAYEFFCLSDDEIILIEDAVERIIPAVQPHEGSYPNIWKTSTASDRRAYATTLVASINNWFRSEGAVSARLEACSADLGILRLTLDSASADYTEASGPSLADVLSRISEHIHQPLDGNFQLMPDIRVFIGKNLYLIKPMQQRFWLRSSALADADAIAMDLQNAVELHKRSRA